MSFDQEDLLIDSSEFKLKRKLTFDKVLPSLQFVLEKNSNS